MHIGDEGGLMRKAVLRQVLGEHLRIIRQREDGFRRVLAGGSRLIDGTADPAGAEEDLRRLGLVERGLSEMLPRAWHLPEPSETRHEVKRVTEAKALVHARATAAVIALTLQQSDREHSQSDVDRLEVATALFRYLRDQLGYMASSGSDADENLEAAMYSGAAP